MQNEEPALLLNSAFAFDVRIRLPEHLLGRIVDHQKILPFPFPFATLRVRVRVRVRVRMTRR
jgi:hypothetical protein